MHDSIENGLPYGRVSRVKNLLSGFHSWQPQLELADINTILDELRWVKTPYEIERLRRSGRMGAEATAEGIRATRPGMYEYEIAAAAQYVSTRLGADGDAFPPIVPSGPLTPIVHYMENRRQMKSGEIVDHSRGASPSPSATAAAQKSPNVIASGAFSRE